MTREILLLRGQVTLVDDADYEALIQYRWRLNNRGYVVRSKTINGREIVVCLHREILQAQRGQIVDHIDHDKLNNTRANLRFITQQQNLMYRRCFRNNRIGYKGVAPVQGKWRPRIQLDGQVIYLGVYESPERAALVYDAAARRLFGPFALLNFPELPPEQAIEELVSRLLADVSLTTQLN